MCIGKKHSIYKTRYYPQFLASTADLGTHSPQIKADYYISTFDIPLDCLEEPEITLFPDCIPLRAIYTRWGLLPSTVIQPMKSNCLNLGYTIPYTLEFAEL